MTIALFKGDFQHGVVNTFVDHLGEALEALGHQVLTIDTMLARDDLGEHLRTLFDTSDLLGLIGFNTLGSQIRVQGRPLHQALGRPFIAWLLDHPIFHLDRLAVLQDQPVLCVDQGHARFLRRQGFSAVTYAPHAAHPSPEPSLSSTVPWAGRPHRLLFAGAVTSPEAVETQMRKTLSAAPQPEVLLTLFSDIAALGTIGDDDALFTQATRHPIGRALLERGIVTSGLALVVQCLNLLNRARVRAELLRHLDRSGICVTLVGPTADNANYRYHRTLGSHGFPAVLMLMQEARFVLNMNQLFRHGLHERVVYAAAAGALLCTHRTSGTAGLLEHASGIQAERTAAEIERLDCTSEGAKMAVRGRQWVHAQHLWAHRASLILKLLDRDPRP